MSTNITKYEDVAVLTLKDDLVVETAEGFKSEVESCMEEGINNIVIDCSTIGGFDSVGLELLLALQDRCEESFGSVKLCSLDATLTKILEITRLMRRFEVFNDLDAAVMSFS